MRRTLIALAIAIAILSPSTTALLESQASKYSWLLQNVGTVTDADLTQHLITLSEQGVLASLGPVDGKLVWRKILSPGARLVSGPGVAVAIETARVRAFSATTGALLWEHPAVEADVAFAANGRLVLTAQDAVHVRCASRRCCPAGYGPRYIGVPAPSTPGRHPL